MMQLLGVIIGLSWWLMCFLIWNCVNYIGLQTNEDEYVYIFIFFTHFCVLASAFNVYLTWYYTRHEWHDPEQSWLAHLKGHLVEGPVSSLRDLQLEIDFGLPGPQRVEQ